MGFIHDIKKVLAVLPQQEAEPAVLGHLQRRDQGAGRPPAEQAGADRGGAPQRRPPSTIAQKVHPVGRERKKDLLAHLIKARRLAPGAGVHAHEARREPPGRAPATSTASARWRSTATRARARAPRRWPTSRAASCRCWWRPTSPRAASTSTSCRTSSTSSCRTCRKTTCTASAAPAAPARSGEAISLVCVDEDGFLRDIEKLIKREIPQEVIAGFEPNPNERAEPIVLGRMVIGEGAGRGGHRHHANHGAPRGRGGNSGNGGNNDGRSNAPRSKPPAQAHGGHSTSHAPRPPARDGAGRGRAAPARAASRRPAQQQQRTSAGAADAAAEALIATERAARCR